MAILKPARLTDVWDSCRIIKSRCFIHFPTLHTWPSHSCLPILSFAHNPLIVVLQSIVNNFHQDLDVEGFRDIVKSPSEGMGSLRLPIVFGSPATMITTCEILDRWFCVLTFRISLPLSDIGNLFFDLAILQFSYQTEKIMSIAKLLKFKAF